jgi:hypothetical protein
VKVKELFERREPSYHEEMVLKGVEYWIDLGFSIVDISIDFNYDPADFTMHPYGMGYAREDHPAQITDVGPIVLLKDAKFYNEDGEVIGKIAKGTDLNKGATVVDDEGKVIKTFTDKELFTDQVNKWLEKDMDENFDDAIDHSDDFDPPDYYDSRY